MAEDEKDKERHELKTKRRDYTGYDDDEFTPGQAGMKRAVLSKYDEDIDGPKQGVRSGSFVDVEQDSFFSNGSNRSALEQQFKPDPRWPFEMTIQ
jgi:U4/U6.U5 tri-snRNP-associated protein 1